MGARSSISRRWPPNARRVLFGAAVLALATLAVGGVGGLQLSDLLTLLPLVALAAIMLTRPYLGERAIARLRSRERVPRLPRAAMHPRVHSAWTIARGGRLIAASLAGRAPPALSAGRW
jgi:hypothetical protein